MVWVHIKKAAGTTLCCEARRREHIPAANINCNYGREDEPEGYLGYGWPSNWTCEERASLMATGNFTWTAIERLVHPQDLCHSSFLYGTILRNPLDFIESITTSKNAYLDYLRYFVQQAQQQGCQIDVLPDFALAKIGVTSQLWFDNFATRSLGGYDLDAVPLGKLNASHLEHAKDVLRRFDIVLLFDLMAEQHSSDVMEDVIGWHVPWERSHENPTESNVTLAAWLSPEQLECLASTNHLDAELVEWVRAEYYP